MNDAASEQKWTVLLVHGRGFKPEADAWSSLSFEALRCGIRRDYPDRMPDFEQLNLEFAYYGDLTNEYLTGLGRRYDEKLDIADRERALEALCAIRPRKRFGIRQYDRLKGKSALGEFVAGITMPLFARIGLTVPMVSLVSKDFGYYLRAPDEYAARVRKRLRTRLIEILKRGDKLMLVSHGTGSAVAWDVLWGLSHERAEEAGLDDRKVDTWVTLGAPLGDAGILKRLRGRHAPIGERYPSNVISWVNLSAEDDYTCHDNTLADDFKKMVRDRYISSVVDYKIYNHAVRYGRSNPHSSIGYYIHPRLTKIIVDWLPAVEGAAEAPAADGEDLAEP